MQLFNFLNVSTVATVTDAATDKDFPYPALIVGVFAVLFLVYVYAMKAVNAKKPAASVPAAAPAPVASAPAAVAPVYTGPALEGVDEREAAVIMAIVSDKTGIPLNRLKFESIRLTEDK